AYDAAHQRVVLFGGGPGTLADTWLWDGDDWTQATPASSPPARFDETLAYDPVHAQVLLFGGTDGTTLFGDTWLWDGTNWTQAQPAVSPPAQRAASAVWNASRRRLELYDATSN